MPDDSYYMPPEAQEPSMLQKLWDARPWKDHDVMNPPSMTPQLMMALGLLHPRLGGATRDLSMATQLARQPGPPAAMARHPAGPTDNLQTMMATGRGRAAIQPQGDTGGFVMSGRAVPRPAWPGVADNAANVNNRDAMRAILRLIDQ